MRKLGVQGQLLLTTSPVVSGKVSQERTDGLGISSGTAWFPSMHHYAGHRQLVKYSLLRY